MLNTINIINKSGDADQEEGLLNLPKLRFAFGLQLVVNRIKSIPPNNSSKVVGIGALHGPRRAILKSKRQALEFQ
jgi:hypothetical protein